VNIVILHPAAVDRYLSKVNDLSAARRSGSTLANNELTAAGQSFPRAGIAGAGVGALSAIKKVFVLGPLHRHGRDETLQYRRRILPDGHGGVLAGAPGDRKKRHLGVATAFEKTLRYSGATGGPSRARPVGLFRYDQPLNAVEEELLARAYRARQSGG
jgi:hypothetical protein